MFFSITAMSALISSMSDSHFGGGGGIGTAISPADSKRGAAVAVEERMSL